MELTPNRKDVLQTLIREFIFSSLFTWGLLSLLKQPLNLFYTTNWLLYPFAKVLVDNVMSWLTRNAVMIKSISILSGLISLIKMLLIWALSSILAPVGLILLLIQWFKQSR